MLKILVKLNRLSRAARHKSSFTTFVLIVHICLFTLLCTFWGGFPENNRTAFLQLQFKSSTRKTETLNLHGFNRWTNKNFSSANLPHSYQARCFGNNSCLIKATKTAKLTNPSKQSIF